MKTLQIGLLGALTVGPLCSVPSAGAEPRKLVAVFAHPDDETMAGPLLAHYARQGAEVSLIIVTNGEKGANPHTGVDVPPGDRLAEVRSGEARCACNELGARPPILLGMPDGGLAQVRILADLAARLEALFEELDPGAIVTWGPDGGYGHPDHRLVSSVVTQIVQAGKATRRLYYAALPQTALAEVTADLHFPAPFAGTCERFLETRVGYTPEDVAAARAALQCHKSQFTPAGMDQLATLSEKINRGTQYLRRWDGGEARTDLFAP
jgi:LmbE family N-acetylglucosaminyl deacetylase